MLAFARWLRKQLPTARDLQRLDLVPAVLQPILIPPAVAREIEHIGAISIARTIVILNRFGEACCGQVMAVVSQFT